MLSKIGLQRFEARKPRKNSIQSIFLLLKNIKWIYDNIILVLSIHLKHALKGHFRNNTYNLQHRIIFRAIFTLILLFMPPWGKANTLDP